MRKAPVVSEKVTTALPKAVIALVFLVGLYFASLYSYVLFHSIAELLSIIVAFAIFAITWNTRRLIDNSYILFLGISFIFIGSIDLVHTLAYKGMGVFREFDANLPTQLWIVARYLHSLSFLIAPFLIGRKLKLVPVFAGYIIVTILLLTSIFYWNIFPTCYVEGAGLTPFKKVSEYVISFIFLASIALLFLKRKTFDAAVLRLLSSGVALTIVSEVAFTQYLGVYDLANFIGHLAKLGAFYLFYKAIVQTGLSNPYAVLYRNLYLSEARFRELYDNMSSGVAVYEARDNGNDFIIKDVNKAAERIEQVKEGTIIGKSVLEVFPGVKDFGLFNVFQRVWHTGRPERYPASFYHDARISGWRENYIYKLPSGEIVAVYDDVTERKQAEEELALRAQLLDNATDSISVRDLEGNYIYVNDAAAKSMGYSKEELLKLKVEQLVAPGYAYLRDSLLDELRKKGEMTLETAARRKDGSISPQEAHSRLIKSGGRELIFNVIRDITERKRAEEELHLKEQILDKATDSILLRELDGTIIYANEMSYKRLGYSKDEFVGKNLRQFLAPEHGGLFESRTHLILEKGQLIFENVYVLKDGSTMPVEVNARIIESKGKKHILAITRDITERKQMQDSLVVTDRLSALGEMSAGFGHELNNPLTIVIGYAQLLLEDERLSEKVKTDVDRIHSQAQRAANIIRDFMAFAHSQPAIKQPTELNMVIDNVLKLREYEQKKKNINVITSFSPDLPAVMADASQLQQVFLDIIMNAEYFMLQAHNKGTITVTTERIGDIVKASFANDGPDIPPENLSKIFNPFFTTKEVGQGTGLGLSISHSIIAEHGGKIYAESEPGKGATFIIELPVALL